MIFSSDYAKYCDIELLSEVSINGLALQVLNNKMVYCPLDVIHLLFNRLEKEQPSVEFTLVSACSDFGLEYNTPTVFVESMQKWMQMVNIPTDLGFKPLVMSARGDIENCKVSDRFNVKMYSWTRSTFDRIPPPVSKWYCVNANIEHERIQQIPFGLPEWARSIDFKKFKNKEKIHKIYVNFQLNNSIRALLKKSLRFDNKCFVRESELSYNNFLDELSQFKFVLCPSGNAADSYRVAETLLCGCIPILLDEIWTKAYDDLPIIKISNWLKLNNNIDYFDNFLSTESLSKLTNLSTSSVNFI